MIELTPTAVEALRSAIQATSTPIAGLRVTAESGGCSGYKYQMGLVESSQPGDFACKKDGLTIFVDPDSADLLTGTTIDYLNGLDGSGFAFDNPNAKSTCSCGKSFC